MKITVSGPKGRSRPVRISMGMTALMAMLLAANALAQGQAIFQFNLPSQSLADSLRALGSVANVNVLYDPPMVAGHKAPALSARMSTEEALTRLLDGAGLVHRFINEHTVVLSEQTPDGGQAEKRAAAAGVTTGDQWRLAQASSPLQAEEKPAEHPATDQTAIQEVIVTAQKRAERLIEVPQAVQVLPADDLVKQGAVKFFDYADSIPGLSFISFGSGSKAVMRGITTVADSSTTTAQYVDDVPYGSGSPYGGNYYMIDVALFDLDRIEVLKGPQGTLYGVSSLGGLIKYVTKRPNTEAFAGEVQAGVAGTEKGSESYNGAVAFNVPMIKDKLAMRASAYYTHEGGFVDNIAQGKADINDTDIQGGRVDLLYTPTENFSIRLNAFLQELERGGQPPVDYTNNGEPRYGDLIQNRLHPEMVDQRFNLSSAVMNYDFGWATLTSVSSYLGQRKDMAIDYTNYYAPILSFFGRSYSEVGIGFYDDLHQFSQEVRLVSSQERRLEWVLGAFYTRERTGSHSQFRVFDLAGNPAVNDLYNYQSRSKFNEKAIFGDVTWKFTDKFDVTAGMRYAQNQVTTRTLGEGLFITPRPQTTSEGNVKTYLANARYKFNDRSTAYVRYATGYRPGGPNFPSINPNTGQLLASPNFEADELKSYELGFKAETADRRFGVDLAVYDIDWNNIQVIIYPFGFGIFVNSPGGAQVQGAEAAFTARPIRGLTLTSGLAYTDARMKDATPAIGAAENERLPISPRFTGTFAIDYEFADEHWRPTLGASVRHISDRKSDFNLSGLGSLYILPEYTTVDFYAGLMLGSVSTQLYVRNAFDERNQLTAFTFNGIQPVIGKPRTIGVSAVMKF